MLQVLQQLTAQQEHTLLPLAERCYLTALIALQDNTVEVLALPLLLECVTPATIAPFDPPLQHKSHVLPAFMLKTMLLSRMQLVLYVLLVNIAQLLVFQRH